MADEAFPDQPLFTPVDHDPDEVTEEEIAALADERTLMAESPEKQARRLLEEALPGAILTVRKLSQTASSDATRLRAAQYIVDRNLGPVGQDNLPGKTPWDELLEAVVVSDTERGRVKR
jgi:hypothetical protein